MPKGIYKRTKPVWNSGKSGTYKLSKPVWNKGLTKETDQRIAHNPGCFKKEHNPWNKGTKGSQPSPSPDHIIYLKKINSERMKTNNPMKNKLSIEKMKLTNMEKGAYERMGKEASKRMKINNPMWDQNIVNKHPMFKKEFRSLGEKIVESILNELNLKYQSQFRIQQYPSRRCYFLDFYLPKYNIGIEFDGHTNHFLFPESDIIRDKNIKWRRNIRILRIIPKDLNFSQILKDKILKFIKSGFRFSKIKKINKIQKSVKVYDLTINRNKNFFVNKKLVHNCPMPLNSDVWDSTICPFNCAYCFANSFRSSLYVSFYDNSKDIGMRYCAPEYFRAELDKLMKYRGRKNNGTPLQRAIGMQIPIRFGIQFEDFLPIEGKKGISLDLLRYLADQDYPVMINTKSTLIGREDYLKALADNSGGSAVHITMISSNERLNKKLEPGAPSFKERIKTAKALIDAGIRVVARIEPLMVFINDRPEDIHEWVSEVKEAGIYNITLDTYSFSANNPKIKRLMEIKGFDFERMFLLMSEVQWLGSLLLGEFIKTLKAEYWVTNESVSCSTFDFGCVPSNDQEICCEVGDLYLEKGGGFSYGNTLTAIRFIKQSKSPATWTMFDTYVEAMGGWLSDSIKMEVFKAWNLSDDPTINPAYFPDWAQGIETHGFDNKGHRVWKYDPSSDFRMEMLNSVIRKL